MSQDQKHCKPLEGYALLVHDPAEGWHTAVLTPDTLDEAHRAAAHRAAACYPEESLAAITPLADLERAHLTKFYGTSTGSGMDELTDIRLRMLQPHELKLAQGFPAAYDLSAARTKRDKVRLIGNSVPPQLAEAVIRANTRRAA